MVEHAYCAKCPGSCRCRSRIAALTAIGACGSGAARPGRVHASYTCASASDVYEFGCDPIQCVFGEGTLTAANGQLIGTLTVNGSISTTMAIPDTTE